MPNIRFIRSRKPLGVYPNIDAVNQKYGAKRPNDIEVLSNGYSTLDDILARAVAAKRPRDEVKQPTGKKGRASIAPINLVRQGWSPRALHRRRKAMIKQTARIRSTERDDYTAHHYHQVSDEVNPEWDLSGAAQDMQLLFEVGYQVANGDKFPEWKSGTEFKAKRDQMLKK